MPLIPYPNVPNLPGVPGLNRNSAGYVGAALTIVGELLPLNLFGQKFGILNQSGAAAIVPDSFVDFEYREEHKIPIYPIEQGSFQSYNKISLPFDIRVTLTCSGNGAMRKSQFLAAIDKLLFGLDLVSVVTPEATFMNCNLVHVDYRRESNRGATLIIAQLWFQEVRVVQAVTVPTTQPSGASAQPLGQLSPTTPKVGGFNYNTANLA